MSKKNPDNWLAPYLNAAGVKKEDLPGILCKSESTVYKYLDLSRKPTDVVFNNLAKILKCDKSDLEKAFDEAKTKQDASPTILKKVILEKLKNCESLGFASCLCSGISDKTKVIEAAGNSLCEAIYKSFDSGGLRPLREVLRYCLKTCCANAMEIPQLSVMREMGMVLAQSLLSHKFDIDTMTTDKQKEFRVQHPFTFRLLLDKSNQFYSREIPVNDAPGLKIGHGDVGGLSINAETDTEIDEKLMTILRRWGEICFDNEPEVNNQPFDEHGHVNKEWLVEYGETLRSHIRENQYAYPNDKFAYELGNTPPVLMARIRDMFGEDLFIFFGGCDDETGEKVSNIKEKEIESFCAFWIQTIDQRKIEIDKEFITSQIGDENKPEPDENNGQPSVKVTVHTGDTHMSKYNVGKVKADAVAIGDGSTVNYSSLDREDLLDLFEQIIKQLPANSEQFDAAVKYRDAIERDEPQKEIGTWLTMLKSTTEYGIKTVEFATKAYELWLKVGGPSL